MRNQAFVAFVILFLLFVSGESIKLYFSEHANYKRMEENLKTSTQEALYYKTRSGESALKVTAQEFTIRELRNTIPTVVKDLKNLYIRPGSVQSYTKSSTEVKKEIVVQVRDSLVYLPDSSRYRARSLQYHDNWFSVSGMIYQDTAKLSIEAKDTITAVIFSERKHPFWWILSKRQTKAVIKNANPSVKIHIQQEIVIKK